MVVETGWAEIPAEVDEIAGEPRAAAPRCLARSIRKLPPPSGRLSVCASWRSVFPHLVAATEGLADLDLSLDRATPRPPSRLLVAEGANVSFHDGRG